MWHRVVMATGFKSVGEAKRHTTYPDFLRWCAFYQEEPWGAEALDIAQANVCQWMYMLWTSKDAPSKGLSDFLVFARKRPFEPRMMEAYFRALAGAKGRVIDGKK